jgi:restriction endonuclease Mrr
MAIPDYEELMLPVLRVAGDGQEHRIGDVIEQLAKDFLLSDEERNQLLPSGKQTTFANRVHWARGYLVQAGLLEATKSATFGLQIVVARLCPRDCLASTMTTCRNSLSSSNFLVGYRRSEC